MSRADAMTECGFRIESIADLRAMQAAVLPFLVRDEANHTIVLNALALAARGMGPAPQCLVLREDGAVVAVAARNQSMVFLACERAAHARLLAQALRDDTTLQGVVGAAVPARAFAEVTGRPFRLHMPLRLHALEGTPDPGAAEGSMRVAAASDLAQLTDWQRAFETEVRLVRTPLDAAEIVARRIAQGQAYVWCDARGEMVCHVGATQIPPSGARIAPVYTPPAMRGRGYAQALVARVCDALTAQGAQRIFLFTDAENPTSNAVYARVGFRVVGEHAHFEFDRA